MIGANRDFFYPIRVHLKCNSKMEYKLLDETDDMRISIRKIRKRRWIPRLYIIVVVMAVACIVLVSKRFVLNIHPTSVLLSASPPLLEDGEDLIITWQKSTEVKVDTKDYLTLSCGTQRDEDDYLVKKSVLEVDDTPNSVRFPGTKTL